MTPDRPLITYVRVSTSRQGRSGLGLEARRLTLGHFAKAEGFSVAREFVEVETGKGSDALDRRPQLKAALAAARKLRCHVAVDAASDRVPVTSRTPATKAKMAQRIIRSALEDITDPHRLMAAAVAEGRVPAL